MISEVKRVTLEWEPEPVGIKTVLRDHKLPVIAKLYGDDYKNFGASRIDLTQPFLLYQHRACLKVVAANLYWDDSQQEYREIGHQVVIPASYPGWFMGLQDLGRTIQPYLSIEEVAKARLQSFISRTPITGYRHERLQDASTFVYTPVQVNAGQLFTVADVFRQYYSRPKTICCCNWIKAERKQMKDPQNSTYLRCINEFGEDLFFLFSEEGEFFPAVRTAAPQNAELAVYRLVDLIGAFQCPMDVKLVHGMPPSSHCSFTGNLRLEEAYKQESVIACTVSMSNPRFIEFPSTSDTRVLVASQKQQYSNYDIYRNTFGYCQQHVESYSKSIKVTQSFFPEAENTEEDENKGQWQHSDQISYFTGSEYTDDEGEDVESKGSKGRRRSRSKSFEEIDSTYEIIPFDMHMKLVEKQSKMKGRIMPVFNRNEENILVNSKQHVDSVSTEKRDKNKGVIQVIDPNLPTNNTKVINKQNTIIKGDDTKVINSPNRGTNLQRDSAGKISVVSDVQSQPIDQFLNQLFDYKTLSHVPSDTEKEMAARLDIHNIQPIPPPPTTGGYMPDTHVQNPNIKLDIPIAPPPPLKRTGYQEDAALIDAKAQVVDTKANMDADNIYVNFSEDKPKTLTKPIIQAANSAFSKYNKSNEDEVFVGGVLPPPLPPNMEQPKHLYSGNKGFGQPAIPVLPPVIKDNHNMENHLNRVTSDSSLCKEVNFNGYPNSPNDSGVYSDRRYSDIESASMQGSALGSHRSPVEMLWYPPEDTRGMSVSEVCESLRFIGIKEHVILHFANEQIDGVQLMELDDGLLKEAFPDMNGLERKKVLDFQKGWRPKKR